MPYTPETPPTRSPLSTRWKRWGAALLVVAAVLSVVVLSGPRYRFGPEIPAARTLPPQDIGSIDSWLKSSEAAFTDIRPGNAKGIIWSGATGQRTPWAIVYLHGFSASRMETAPLTDEVAKALGANVFYTRLSGHGRSNGAMAEATPQDWLADLREATQIGRALGQRVLFISCSTGSTLATLLATSDQAKASDAHVFISPNFGPKDKRSEIILGPWGQQIAFGLLGPEYGWTAQSTEETLAWTTRYPTKSIFPMMALVQHAREQDLTRFQNPVLVLYSERDATVDPQETRTAFQRFGAPLKKLEEVTYSESPGQHVLAGAIRAPKAVAPMKQAILQWVQALPQGGTSP